MTVGSSNLLALAERLREKAGHVREFHDHRQSAEVMLDAADALERLAPLDPDPDVERGEN